MRIFKQLSFGIFLLLTCQSFAQNTVNLQANIKIHFISVVYEDFEPFAVYNVSAIDKSEKFPFDLLDHYEIFLYDRLFRSTRQTKNKTSISDGLKFHSVKTDKKWSVELKKVSYRLSNVRYLCKLSKRFVCNFYDEMSPNFFHLKGSPKFSTLFTDQKNQ